MQVTFIPVRPDQIEAALTEGVGDLIAYGLVVTPEREQQVAFSIPIQTDVKQIVVDGKGVRPGFVACRTWAGRRSLLIHSPRIRENLEKVNDSLRKQGKPAILIQTCRQELDGRRPAGNG